MARARQPTAGPSTGQTEDATPSRTEPSPTKDTSSSGTNANTAATSPLTGTAFSPLALAFRHSGIDNDGNQTPDPSLPLTIQSGTQNRFQLLQRFYDLHLGSSSHARAIFQYENVGSGKIGRATTTSAMDTLCIAQIATSFRDPQMMAESRRLYSQTMRMLGAKIRTIGESTPSPEHLDDVIGAIHALTACSWFSCVGVGALDWTKHAQALLRVLKVRLERVCLGSGQVC
jgi:hypothetical protein